MPLGTIGLATYRWNNVYKAFILLALFPLIFFYVLWWQIYAVTWLTHSASYSSWLATDLIIGPAGAAILAAAFLWLIYTWRNHSSIMRGLAVSAALTSDAPTSEPRLQAIIERLCIQTGLPLPELEIMETAARNSFVCSDGEGTNCLFITRGLIEALSEDEIEAVIAHELAHIINNDSRLLSFGIAFCGLFPLLVEKIQIALPFEPPAAKYDIQLHEMGPAILLFILFFPLWVAYILTSVVRIFLFMNREYDADAKALEITKNPDALMRALKRIHRHARMPFGSYNLKFLCIDNPEGGVFSTHPRLYSRLALISLLGNCPVPEIKSSQAAPMHIRFKANQLLKREFKAKDPNAPKPFNAPWK